MMKIPQTFAFGDCVPVDNKEKRLALRVGINIVII